MGNLCFKDNDDNRLNNYPGYTGSPIKGNTPPKGNSPIEGAGKGYMFYNGMDDNNKKAMDVWNSEGIDATIKHMTTGADGKPRSYAEMRQMYG